MGADVSVRSGAAGMGEGAAQYNAVQYNAELPVHARPSRRTKAKVEYQTVLSDLRIVIRWDVTCAHRTGAPVLVAHGPAPAHPRAEPGVHLRHQRPVAGV